MLIWGPNDVNKSSWSYSKLLSWYISTSCPLPIACCVEIISGCVWSSNPRKNSFKSWLFVELSCDVDVDVWSWLELILDDVVEWLG